MLFSGLDFDDGIGMAEFDGIVQKVVQYLLNFANVGIYQQFITCENQFDGDGFILAGSFKRSSRIADDFVDVKKAFIQHDSPSIQII